MDFETIILKRQDNIATIILNRPDRLNAMSYQMVVELAKAIEEVAKDDELRVLVLTGAGRAFCAGADFRFSDVREGKLTPETAEDQRETIERRRRGHLYGLHRTHIVLGLQRLEKPTIAMVNGAAVGAGFDHALACDIRIGSTNARFMEGFIKVGVNPDLGGTWLMPRVIGLGKALEYIFTGDFCDAEEAYRIGLLNKLVPPEELEAETMKMATKLAKGPPVALRLSKFLVYKGLQVDLETALGMESACVNIALGTEDNKEAIQALAEKRPPVFKGK